MIVLFISLTCSKSFIAAMSAQVAMVVVFLSTYAINFFRFC